MPSFWEAKLDKEKRKRLVQLRQALEGLKMKSFFDFSSKTEATRGARRWSWTKKSGTDCPGATGKRRALTEDALCLPKRLACDPSS